MTDDEKNNIANFLSAAKHMLAGGDQAAEERAKMRKSAAINAAKMAYYNQFIKPFADTLCALPEKSGRKFSCTVRYDNDRIVNVLRIKIIYHAANALKPDYLPSTKKLSIGLYGDENNISPSFLAYDDASKAESSVIIPLHSATEAPAALGKWVAMAAPERLAELEKSLRNGEPRKIKVFKPLQL